MYSFSQTTFIILELLWIMLSHYKLETIIINPKIQFQINTAHTIIKKWYTVQRFLYIHFKFVWHKKVQRIFLLYSMENVLSWNSVFHRIQKKSAGLFFIWPSSDVGSLHNKVFEQNAFMYISMNRIFSSQRPQKFLQHVNGFVQPTKRLVIM